MIMPGLEARQLARDIQAVMLPAERNTRQSGSGVIRQVKSP
jgi:hypothetical protein